MNYQSPEFEEIRFSAQIVIATSGALGEGIDTGEVYDENEWN